MTRLSWLVAATLLIGPATVLRANDWDADPDVADRLNQLEAETQSLRAEVEYLQAHPVHLPPTQATAASVASLAAAPADDDKTQWFTLGELKAAMEKMTWTKGDFRIIPYGALWADMVYQTSRTEPGAYTFFVPQESVEGEDAFITDARRTRLGFDLTGPRIPLLHNAQSQGQLEIDFEGNFITENKPGVQLRHAYWEAKDDDFRVLIGQTSDVISPLLPNTVNYSVGWMAGNIGFRRAQLRYERFFHLSPVNLLTAQVSLNQDIVTDFPTIAGIDREPTAWPVLEGRLATTCGDRSEGGLPVTAGISGHIGETGFDFRLPGPPPLALPPADDMRFRSWSFNVDFYAPLTKRLGVQGEYFIGANLSPFLGGIGQGVCPCLRVPIRGTGGWTEIWYDWSPRLHSHMGYSVDDPVNADSLLGRRYNQYFFANLMFDITAKLTTGFEVSVWKTLYHEERVGQIPDNQLEPADAGESVVFDWMFKYAF
ncbi:MAG: hypothetical protein A2W31_05440 [Planctomycetes bacterium RBG_16_64_10]|nr:MAG: hypothetical protein A2W31_05440 [Planctomycetes bacterium RBG_16_64_10]